MGNIVKLTELMKFRSNKHLINNWRSINEAIIVF